MIDPCVKRSIQERDMIAEVKKQTEIMRKKVDECEFLIQKAQKKTLSVDDLSR